jgi:hypothetical protein
MTKIDQFVTDKNQVINDTKDNTTSLQKDVNSTDNSQIQ